MVEHRPTLDTIFGSLADSTRRDILRRVAKKALSVNEIAQSYDMTLAAISKHLMVLQRAKLIRKHRRGKRQFVALSPPAFRDASQYLAQYTRLWEDRFDQLEALLKEK